MCSTDSAKRRALAKNIGAVSEPSSSISARCAGSWVTRSARSWTGRRPIRAPTSAKAVASAWSCSASVSGSGAAEVERARPR